MSAWIAGLPTLLKPEVMQASINHMGVGAKEKATRLKVPATREKAKRPRKPRTRCSGLISIRFTIALLRVVTEMKGAKFCIWKPNLALQYKKLKELMPAPVPEAMKANGKKVLKERSEHSFETPCHRFKNASRPSPHKLFLN